MKMISAAENQYEVAEKLGERIDGLETAVKSNIQMTERHQEYLTGLVNAKPGEEQTFHCYFKYLEAEIIKLKVAPRSDTKVFD